MYVDAITFCIGIVLSVVLQWVMQGIGRKPPPNPIPLKWVIQIWSIDRITEKN